MLDYHHQISLTESNNQGSLINDLFLQSFCNTTCHALEEWNKCLFRPPLYRIRSERPLDRAPFRIRLNPECRLVPAEPFVCLYNLVSIIPVDSIILEKSLLGPTDKFSRVGPINWSGTVPNAAGHIVWALGDVTCGDKCDPLVQTREVAKERPCLVRCGPDDLRGCLALPPGLHAWEMERGILAREDLWLSKEERPPIYKRRVWPKYL